MLVEALGGIAAVGCAGVGLVAVAGVAVFVWRSDRPKAKDPERELDVALGESLVHEMLGGESPTPEAQEAADNARLYARGGRCAALLEAATRWETAGGKPRNRGAFNDARRALETRI